MSKTINDLRRTPSPEDHHIPCVGPDPQRFRRTDPYTRRRYWASEACIDVFNIGSIDHPWAPQSGKSESRPKNKSILRDKKVH